MISTEASGPLPANEQLMREYLLASKNRLAAGSVRQYEESLGEFIDALGATALADVSASTVRTYFNERTREMGNVADSRRWAPRTAAKHHTALHRFFMYLVLHEHVAGNPVDGYQVPRFEVTEQSTVPDSTLDLLLQYIEKQIPVPKDSEGSEQPEDVAKTKTPKFDSHTALYILDAALYGFMHEWGTRVTETTHIQFSDIILRGENELFAGIRNTRGAVRMYPISGELLVNYMRWIELRATLEKAKGHENYLFVHPWTGCRITRQRSNKRLRVLAGEAGLDETKIATVTPREFRRLAKAGFRE